MMTEITDPARELADVCERLVSPGASQSGAALLAERFGVEEWSTEFYQMIFHIRGRIDHLTEIVAVLDIAPELREQAIGHAKQVQKAFSPEGLDNPWSHASTRFISPEHVGPLKFLLLAVGGSVSYPKLGEDERNEISGMVAELLAWLGEHQIKEHDFIRQNLIEGLAQFQFRFDRFQWLGWGYALQSLREVIGAYMMLKGSPPISTRLRTRMPSSAKPAR